MDCGIHGLLFIYAFIHLFLCKGKQVYPLFVIHGTGTWKDSLVAISEHMIQKLILFFHQDICWNQQTLTYYGKHPRREKTLPLWSSAYVENKKAGNIEANTIMEASCQRKWPFQKGSNLMSSVCGLPLFFHWFISDLQNQFLLWLLKGRRKQVPKGTHICLLVGIFWILHKPYA